MENDSRSQNNVEKNVNETKQSLNQTEGIGLTSHQRFTSPHDDLMLRMEKLEQTQQESRDFLEQAQQEAREQRWKDAQVRAFCMVCA